MPVPLETTVSDSFDYEDRLKSRTGGGLNVSVLYNGDGQRVAETVGGQTVTYLVDDLNPTGYAQVVEERTNGTVTRTYTYGHDLLAQDTRDGGGSWSASYFGYDGHGSVRFLTNDLGALTDTYSYDAYGTLLASTGTTANRYRYAGEEFDPSLGLYHLRARYLNAANGRFWNADTYEGQSTDPQSLHRYNYAHGNPANLSDPSGHTPSLAATMTSIAYRYLFLPVATGPASRIVGGGILAGGIAGYQIMTSEYFVSEITREMISLSQTLHQFDPRLGLEVIRYTGSLADAQGDYIMQVMCLTSVSFFNLPAINYLLLYLNLDALNQLVDNARYKVLKIASEYGITMDVQEQNRLGNGLFIASRGVEPASYIRPVNDFFLALMAGNRRKAELQVDILSIRMKQFGDVTVMPFDWNAARTRVVKSLETVPSR